jgi:hypothetical protein
MAGKKKASKPRKKPAAPKKAAAKRKKLRGKIPMPGRDGGS